MRSAILFVLAAVAGAAPVQAQSDPVPLYAQALRAFNGRLEPQQADTLARTVIAQADVQEVDARLLVALIAVESSWNPRAVSPVGAVGLGQLMPATAQAWAADPTDPQANIRAVAAHVRYLLNRYANTALGARYVLVLAAYNAGTGAVERYGGVPPYPETRAYVTRVLRLWHRLAGR